MKIVVLNGSPKGDISITVQYVLFIKKKFPQHELKILNISSDICAIERDDNAFNKIIDEVRSSDGILWVFPVYFALVPSQYKRFVELIFEKRVEEAFKDKYTAILSTSARIFDHTAHCYMNAICDDLEMKFVDFYSAEMDDILKEEERNRLILFAEYFFEAIENKYATLRKYESIPDSTFNYIPGRVESKIDIGDKKIVIVTDSEDGEANLSRMIERFRQSFNKASEVVNLHNINIKGGCKGCFHCWYDNICVCKDEFVSFFNSKIIPADIIITAGTLKDRFLSSKLKQFWDRAFYNHHKPYYLGKQTGSIISGPAGRIRNLIETCEGGMEYMRANPAGVVTDEYEDSARIDTQLQTFAERLIHFSNIGYVRPPTFLGAGSKKIVRDLISGRGRFILPDDHKYHKKHGLYDYPYKNLKMMALNMIMIPLTKIPAIRKEITPKIKSEMIKPYQKIVNTK